MNFSQRRRQLLGLTLPLALQAVPLRVHAQSADAFPTRPIKVMVGFPPGGSTDIPMRALAEKAGQLLGQPVVIENRPGAGGTLPPQILQSTAPDGYVLGVSNIGIYRLPFTTDMTWDPVEDLSYIIGITGYAFGIVVASESPIKSFADFIAYAKARPGELSYGTPGMATTNHLTMERVSQLAGIKLNHIPFKGNVESLQAVMGGHVMAAAETTAWVPHVESGKMRLLVTWGERRMARFPDVPTLKESGMDLVQTSPWGIAGPRRLDPKVVAKLHAAFKQAMDTPEFRAALRKFDMEVEYRDPAAYKAFAVESHKRERDVMLALGFNRK